jgi:hypothetical protein
MFVRVPVSEFVAAQPVLVDATLNSASRIVWSFEGDAAALGACGLAGG